MLQRTPATLLEPLPATRPDRDAVKIGELYRKGNASLIDSARYYLQCGQRLIAKKDELGHGEWLPWLAANADVLGFETRRTAARLMKGAAKWDASVPFDTAQARQFNRELWHNDIANGWVNSGNDEWFTSDRELNLARAALGGTIDLDPASCAAAQRRVRAKRFFTKETDGREQQWRGAVFLNPPYSLITKFTEKLIKEYAAGHITAP
jgi:hypothetical protein